MPNIRSRLTVIGITIFSFLYMRPWYPVWYQRFGMSKVGPMLTRAPRDVRFERVIVDGIPAVWLTPEGADNGWVFLFIHGGAFVIGSIESHWKMAAQIARAAGCRALIIDYRLAPESKFPAAVEDSLNAYRWLLTQGYEPGRVVIGGDSAGGCLTALILLSLRDSGDTQPAAGVMMSPCTDLAVTGETIETKKKEDPMIDSRWGGKCHEMYLGAADPRDPHVSPLYADLKGLPPMLIQVGSREVLLDDARRFADRARQDGVEVELEVWEGMFHVFQYCSPFMPESMDAIRRIGEYCRNKMA